MMHPDELKPKRKLERSQIIVILASIITLGSLIFGTYQCHRCQDHSVCSGPDEEPIYVKNTGCVCVKKPKKHE